MHKLEVTISHSATNFTSSVLYNASGALKPNKKALKQGLFYL
jgi:hypothetical protein